jgi:restriction endonuclease Mrr
MQRGGHLLVERIEGKKVLIGCERLPDLMIEQGVGVTTFQFYELKEVSNDFFDTDEG